MEISPYKLLANAIVKQAAKDWRYSARRLCRNPGNIRAKATKKETERFFRSSWFEMLTDLDGETLLRKLKEGYS
ncbi:MAG: hypothetical protein K6C12_12970 [Oscillospiraceae bacterium]|nr:hypothetical protein [Oscillospiraceae bacterium]